MIGLIAFKTLFPEVARREVQVAEILGPGEGGEPWGTLPAGAYAFTEFYCVDRDCDCRRVILRVVDEETQAPLAVIAYGFDRDEPQAGPFLDPMNYQSEHSQALLELAEDAILTEPDYLEQLEDHYQLVKDAILDPAHPIHARLAEQRAAEEAWEGSATSATLRRAEPKLGRNDPCLCGSGKKFKRCCRLAPSSVG